MSSGTCRSSAPSRRGRRNVRVTFLTLPSTHARGLAAGRAVRRRGDLFRASGLGIRARHQSRAARLAHARAKIPAHLDPGPHDPTGARRHARRHSRTHRAGRRLAAPADHQCRDRSAPLPRACDRLAARAARVDERAGDLDRARPEAARAAARRIAARYHDAAAVDRARARRLASREGLAGCALGDAA